jgi:hypothetical protein
MKAKLDKALAELTKAENIKGSYPKNIHQLRVNYWNAYKEYYGESITVQGYPTKTRVYNHRNGVNNG